MATNDLEVEKMMRNNLSYGDLGSCFKCKGGFLPEDEVVEVVRGVRPRHKKCWEDEGKPYRRPWGRKPWRGNEERMVHIRKGLEADFIGYLYIDECGYVPNLTSHSGLAIYGRGGDGAKEKMSEVTRCTRELAAEWTDLEQVPLFHSLYRPDFDKKVDALNAEIAALVSQSINVKRIAKIA